MGSPRLLHVCELQETQSITRLVYVVAVRLLALALECYVHCPADRWKRWSAPATLTGSHRIRSIL